MRATHRRAARPHAAPLVKHDHPASDSASVSASAFNTVFACSTIAVTTIASTIAIATIGKAPWRLRLARLPAAHAASDI